MSPSVSKIRRYCFGPYEVDLHSGELIRDGIPIRLQAQPFQLLVMLLERPGELVTRKEICQKLWSTDTFVDFDRSLGTAINKIRDALQDSATDPHFVETLPRRGYRFLGSVSSVDSDPIPTPPDPVPPPTRNKVLFVSLAVAMALATLLGVSNFHGLRQQVASTIAGPPPIRSLAVLPLINLSNDPDQQYFADGMTDELITDLAQISSLRVISRTSAMAYLGSRKPAAQIARELGVDALVEGSVVRSGHQVRITAQLIHAASDRHLWARSYDRGLSDVLTVQGEVAREIAESIALSLTPQERVQLARSHPVNPEVALLYFKGSYFLSKLDAVRAKDIFTEAIHLDPNSAESWAGLADSFHTLAVQGDSAAYASAKDAANKALAIDGSQAQALMVLGIVSFIHDWNPTASEVYFRRSIASRPGYAMARALFANTLAHHGKYDEAIEQIKLASASDPVSLLTNSMAWHVYFSARRYDDALRVIRGTLELDPNFGPAHGWLTRSWEQKGEYRKAIDAGQFDEHDAKQLRAALASEGPSGYWKKKLELNMYGRAPGEQYGFSLVARCYMHLGEPEKAIEVLEDGYRRRDPFLIFWLPVYEEFDPLRSDPRFQTMLRGLGMS